MRNVAIGMAVGLVFAGLLAACAASSRTASSGQTRAPLTDGELLAITAGGLVPIPADAPAPKIDAATAEARVRATYRGQRQTIEVRRIAIKLVNGVRVGWEVALTPEAGAPCTNHPGLLERAIEGGIVDDQTGDMFWTGTCF